MAATNTTAPGKPAEAEKPANLPPATNVDAAGAPQQVVPDVDMAHPAVDADPRAGTSVAQNQIDFNDPTLTGAEASARALNAQGVPTNTSTETSTTSKGK